MIDAHCHLQNVAFGKDEGMEDIIAEACLRGVTRFVVNGTSESDWGKVAELARTHSEIIPSFGLHPWYVRDRTESWLEELEFWIDQFPDAGIGEIGLDRWINDYDIDDQQRVFEKQWNLAMKKERPISLHCLKAWGPLDQALKHLPRTRFLLHSYSGSFESVPVFVEYGAFFSISGYFLKSDKATKAAVFEHVPEDRLLLETDSPDMRLPRELDLFPERSYNHPANLSVIFQDIARRRKISPDEFESQLTRNFTNFWHRYKK